MTELPRAAFGTLVMVAIDGTLEEAELEPEERAHFAQLGDVRRRTWLAGRVALRRALSTVGARIEPVLTGSRGEPRLPEGVAASIAHKESVAVALADLALHTLGVDVEYDRPPRVDIVRRVLTPHEVEQRQMLCEADRARAVPVAFSVKEAIYKAIHPFCARYVGFQEVELDLRSLREGAVGVRLLLAPHPFTAGSLEVSARWESATSPSGEPLLIAMARAERRAD